MEFLRQVLVSARDRPACLVTVIRSSGSTPRHPGAKMLVFADGSALGTIGGGRVELEATQAAAQIAAGAPAQRREFHLVRDLAMCCGGSMELYLEPLNPSLAALDEAVESALSRRAVVLTTPLDGGAKSTASLEDAISTGLQGDRFVEVVRPPDRAILFGFGHVCRALGPVLAELGFDVVVCDDNYTGAIEEDIAWASRVVPSFECSEVEAEIGALGAGDFAIVLTRDHAIDQKILESLLSRVELEYLGVIGSKRKIASFRKRLASKGICSEEEWRRVTGPVGIDIGAETPAEIAVSIAAQLIALRHAVRSGPE